MRKRTLLLLGFILMLVLAFKPMDISAQSLVLEKTISLVADSLPLDITLDRLSKQCDCYFTYNADLIDGTKLVSINVNQVKLKTVLDSLLNNSTLKYEQLNNQVVIHPVVADTIEVDSTIAIPNSKLSGIVRELNSKVTLPYATISIKGKPFGVLTNNNGEFLFNIPDSLMDETLEFSYMGYYNYEIPIRHFPNNGIIELEPGVVSLQEVVVRSTNPLLLVRKVRGRLKNNYYDKSFNYTAFYRESIQQRSSYVAYSEALLSGYKSKLNKDITDKVELIKGRKFFDINEQDTLLIKLRGGINTCLQLDIIRNIPDFLSTEGESLYDYHMTDILIWQNELVYVVEFKQKPHITDLLMEGILYITTNNFALVGAEFMFTPDKISSSKKLFVLRKSRNIKVNPVSSLYQVKYSNRNGKYYTSYVSGELEVRVRKKRELFAKNYVVNMEMAYTNYNTLNVSKPKAKYLFKTNTIFSDAIYTYDYNYWGIQNIIKPEKNILNAFDKSGFKLEQKQ